MAMQLCTIIRHRTLHTPNSRSSRKVRPEVLGGKSYEGLLLLCFVYVQDDRRIDSSGIQFLEGCSQVIAFSVNGLERSKLIGIENYSKLVRVRYFGL